MIDIDGKSFLPVDVVDCFEPHDDSASDTPYVAVLINSPWLDEQTAPLMH